MPSTPGRSLANVLTLCDLHFRLYRRVVEIRDGFLALRSYGDPEAAAAVLDCLGETEAPVMGSIGGVDLPVEVLVLERFARCYARSPLVQAVRLEALRKHASASPEP